MENSISAEIEVLKYTLKIEHVLLLYTDGRRVVAIDHKDFKTVMDYLEIQEFTLKSVVKTDSQYLISF